MSAFLFPQEVTLQTGTRPHTCRLFEKEGCLAVHLRFRPVCPRISRVSNGGVRMSVRVCTRVCDMGCMVWSCEYCVGVRVCVWGVYMCGMCICGVCVCAYVPVGVCVNVGLSGTCVVWVWCRLLGVGLAVCVDGVGSCVVCV